MKIVKEIAMFSGALLFFAAAIWISATLRQAYVKDVARGVAREEIRQLDARIDAIEDSVFGPNLEEGESP